MEALPPWLKPLAFGHLCSPLLGLLAAVDVDGTGAKVVYQEDGDLPSLHHCHPQTLALLLLF